MQFLGALSRFATCWSPGGSCLSAVTSMVHTRTRRRARNLLVQRLCLFEEREALPTDFCLYLDSPEHLLGHPSVQEKLGRIPFPVSVEKEAKQKGAEMGANRPVVSATGFKAGNVTPPPQLAYRFACLRRTGYCS